MERVSANLELALSMLNTLGHRLDAIVCHPMQDATRAEVRSSRELVVYIEEAVRGEAV